MDLSPKESGKLVSELSQHVKINEGEIAKLGDTIMQSIKSGELLEQQFESANLYPKPDKPWAADWFFVANILNFCFWYSPSTTSTKTWRVERKSGYFALCNALNRALRELHIIFYPFPKKIYDIFKHGSKRTTVLARLKRLHEAGALLLEKFDGSFTNCVKQANNSAVRLLHIIVDNFECFRDEAVYKGNKVAFYHQAQMLVADIWSCYRNVGIGYFSDIDAITTGSSYRIPQVLFYYDVFEYSEELKALLESKTFLQGGSEMEVEIRGSTIHAVTLLVDYIMENFEGDGKANCILVDRFLWDLRSKRGREFHEKKNTAP